MNLRERNIILEKKVNLIRKYQDILAEIQEVVKKNITKLKKEKTGLIQKY